MPRGRTPYASLPAPPTEGTDKAHELARGMRYVVERTTPAQLMQLVDLALIRHSYGAFATRAMLRTLVREVSALQAPRRRTRGRPPPSK